MDVRAPFSRALCLDASLLPTVFWMDFSRRRDRLLAVPAVAAFDCLLRDVPIASSETTTARIAYDMAPTSREGPVMMPAVGQTSLTPVVLLLSR